MSLVDKEMRDEFKAFGLKDRSKNVRVLKQVGKSVTKIDRKRKALAAGKRISSTGKVYWETRKNRSDAVGKTV